MMVLRRVLRTLPLWGGGRRAVMTGAGPLTLPRLPIFEALDSHPRSKTAVVRSESGERWTYGDLLADTARYKEKLMFLDEESGLDLKERRIAFLAENGYDYVVTMLSIFASGGIAVPLLPAHPPREVAHVLSNSTPSLLLRSYRFAEQGRKYFDIAGTHTCDVMDIPDHKPHPAGVKNPEVKLTDTTWMNPVEGTPRGGRGALIVYTSGTTNLPKGVVSTHRSLTAQITSLTTTWHMTPTDHLLHVLPLHHVHGIVNATLAPLFAGGTVEYLYPFSAPSTWQRLAAAPTEKPPVSLFMAVPTIYTRLLQSFPSLPQPTQTSATSAVRSLRLAISGSAALPQSTKDAWRTLAEVEHGGGTILERYGMTELGMALSQRLPLEDRPANSVGWPLPGVEVRLVDTETGEVVKGEGEGEIQVRGDTVFREYWGNRKATEREFAEEGWFKTGDVAVRDGRGAYYILGRASVDIIKSGGEKISALEVERQLLELPQISEAAVIGVPDPEWGQRVAAMIALSAQGEREAFGYDDMRKAMKQRIAGYKVPAVLRVVEALKRNQMGKINKKELGEVFKVEGGRRGEGLKT